MAEERMTDGEILERMGLSDEELREFLRKINIFYNTLNDKERLAFLKGLKSVREAADQLDEDVTPERLEEFIRNHEPEIIVFAICKRNP
jgi:phage antirepressor YoqD-like protein